MNSVTDIRERLAFETADVSVHSITTLLVGLLMISGNRLKKKNLTKFPQNKWFDAECKTQKRRVNDANKLYICFPHSSSYRDNYYQEKRELKKLIKRKKTQMYMHLHNRLLNMCPRQFWRIVKPHPLIC